MAWLMAGVMTDLADELDEADSWREVSGSYAGLNRGDPPHDGDGAWHPDGSTFGTWEDATDVVEVVFAETQFDVALAALALDPLDDIAAALVALAFDGVDKAHDAVATTLAAEGPAEGVRLATDAVCFLAHRQRATGLVAPLPSMTTGLVLTWGWKADERVEAGQAGVTHHR